MPFPRGSSDPGIMEQTSPALQADSLPLTRPGRPYKWTITLKKCESLCCIPETYNIINQLYLNKRK